MSDGQTITGSARFTGADQWRAFYWMLPRYGRYGVIAAPIMLVALIVAQAFSPDGIAWVLWGGLFAIGLLPLILAYSYRRLSEAQKQLSYAIDAQQIVVRDAAGTMVTVQWSLARRAIETRHGFLVALEPFGGRWLPKRAFAPDAVAALRALIGQKLGPAARLAA